jgi:hypothetical protein
MITGYRIAIPYSLFTIASSFACKIIVTLTNKIIITLTLLTVMAKTPTHIIYHISYILAGGYIQVPVFDFSPGSDFLTPPSWDHLGVQL